MRLPFGIALDSRTTTALRYGVLPLFSVLGGTVAAVVTMGALARGRAGHCAAIGSIVALLSVLSLLGVGHGSVAGENAWGWVSASAVLVLAVSYMVGVALRASWNWKGDHRHAIALTTCALVALAGTIHLTQVLEGRDGTRLVQADPEKASGKRAQVLLLEFVAEMDRAGKPIDDEALSRFRSRLLATKI
jgi:hypothetical protein